MTVPGTQEAKSRVLEEFKDSQGCPTCYPQKDSITNFFEEPEIKLSLRHIQILTYDHLKTS